MAIWLDPATGKITGDGTHTVQFRVTVPIGMLRDRALESIDAAVAALREIDGVTVTGWGDE